MANYLLDGRRKLENKLIRGVPNLPINIACVLHLWLIDRHRLEASSRKNLLFCIVDCCIGKALLLLQFGSSFISVLEQKWLEVFIILNFRCYMYLAFDYIKYVYHVVSEPAFMLFCSVYSLVILVFLNHLF